MTTTIRIPEEFYRRLKLKDNLRWGSAHRYNEWHRTIVKEPWGRQKVRL